MPDFLKRGRREGYFNPSRPLYPCRKGTAYLMNNRNNSHPFHVAVRTDNLQRFEKPLNTVFEMFVDELRYLHQHQGLAVHAFVLMSNHFHLLCHTPMKNLPEIMETLLKSTANNLSIHWDTFRWSMMDSQTHYLNTYRYILQNPVRAKLCERVEEYGYSTLKETRLPIYALVPFAFAGLEGELRWLNGNSELEDRFLRALSPL